MSSQGPQYVFYPIVYDSQKAVPKAPQTGQQEGWVDYQKSQNEELVGLGYIRGVVYKFQNNNLEFYYTGNLCHRLYGIIIKTSQKQQHQHINIPPDLDYFVIVEKEKAEEIKEVYIPITSLKMYTGPGSEKIDKAKIQNMSNEIKKYEKILKDRELYFITP